MKTNAQIRRELAERLYRESMGLQERPGAPPAADPPRPTPTRLRLPPCPCGAPWAPYGLSGTNLCPTCWSTTPYGQEIQGRHLRALLGDLGEEEVA